MNPLHSPRNAHSKTEFRKKNSKKKFGESETFSGSKFDPATGVRSSGGGIVLRRILLRRYIRPHMDIWKGLS